MSDKGGSAMSIAQSYVACACISAALGMVALLMLYMGMFRRGTDAALDDAGAGMLTLFGVIILIMIAAFWLYASSMIPAGMWERLLR